MMARTINQRYRQWYKRDFLGLRDRLRQLSTDFNTERDIEVRAEQKRRQPRARTKFNDLPEDVSAAIVERLRKKYLEDLGGDLVSATLDQARKLKADTLDELAAQVMVIPADYCCVVKGSHTGGYSSQGYGMHKYARDSLLPQEAALKALGLETHVNFKLQFKGEGRFNCGDSGTYQLWADCPEWMADSVFRRITVDDALRALPCNTNAKVLMPFLSHEKFDKHMAGGYRKKEPA